MKISRQIALLVKSIRGKIEMMHFPRSKGGREVLEVLGTVYLICGFLFLLILVLATR